MADIQPGLCSVTFRELSPDQIVALAADAGIAGIEWGADRHVPVGDLGSAAAVAETSSGAGISCPSYGTYLGVQAPIADRDEVVLTCRTARALGSDNLRIWAPMHTDSTADADARAPITAGVALAAEIAADHGLTVGVEFHAWTITDTATSATRLMADVDADNLFSYWQPIYWNDTAHDHVAQLASMRGVRDHLSHLHTYWWGAGRERRPLAEGAPLWPDVIADVGAAATRWDGPRYAFLEFVADDDPAAMKRDAATLAAWLSAAAPSPPS